MSEQKYGVELLSDDWWGIVHIPSGQIVETYRRKCHAFRRFNRCYWRTA